MEELKLTPEELKIAIENSKVLGKGFFGTTFTYQDKLIKLDNRLFDILKSNDLENCRWAADHIYKWDKSDFNSRTQIEELVKRQPNITLTKLPLGIVTLKGVEQKNIGISPGILIPYHKDHEMLEKLSKDDYKKILIILKKLLLAVRELADNEIAQNDLYNPFNGRGKKSNQYNVMYQGDTPQIIDMSGSEIKVGKEYRNAKLMYQGLGNIIMDYFDFNNLKSPYDMDKVESEQQVHDMINEFEKETKGK